MEDAADRLLATFYKMALGHFLIHEVEMVPDWMQWWRGGGVDVSVAWGLPIPEEPSTKPDLTS